MTSVARHFNWGIRTLRHRREKVVVDLFHDADHLSGFALLDTVVRRKVGRGQIVGILANVTVDTTHAKTTGEAPHDTNQLTELDVFR